MLEKIRKFFKALGKKEGGFTLIELAVILAVIGILAAVGVMKYVDVTSGARTTAAQARFADVKTCISMAVAKYGGQATAANAEDVIVAAHPTYNKGDHTFSDIASYSFEVTGNPGALDATMSYHP